MERDLKRCQVTNFSKGFQFCWRDSRLGLLRKSPQKKEQFFSPSLSLSLFSDCLQPVLFSSFVSLFSMLGLVHSFKGRRRRRSSGGYTHKSEPDFQHLLQSRKTAVWNDFGLAKAFACAPSRLRRDAFLYSIESSKSTGAYVFELFSTEGRPNDRLTPLSFTRWHDEF